MRTVLIDDESKSRQTLLNFITKYSPELEVIGQADCVDNGVELINNEKPELVFLDIQMPDGTGFDLLGQVEFTNFKLIFCTSHDHYAIKAFRFSALDYLLKPIDPDIFIAAVKKALLKKDDNLKDKIDVLNTNKTNFSRIALNSFEGIDLVNINDIVRCESNVNYTKFIIHNKPSILVSKTLKEYDEILSQHGFIRIHKSHLVNLRHITKFIKDDSGWVIMTDNSKIQVSRRKKEYLLNILGKL